MSHCVVFVGDIDKEYADLTERRDLRQTAHYPGRWLEASTLRGPRAQPLGDLPAAQEITRPGLGQPNGCFSELVKW